MGTVGRIFGVRLLSLVLRGYSLHTGIKTAFFLAACNGYWVFCRTSSHCWSLSTRLDYSESARRDRQFSEYRFPFSAVNAALGPSLRYRASLIGAFLHNLFGMSAIMDSYSYSYLPTLFLSSFPTLTYQKEASYLSN